MRRRIVVQLLSALALGTVGAACASSSPSGEHEGTSAEALTGGAADLPSAQSPDANIVVAIENADGSAPACSGVLLTPTTVLTASRCVSVALGAWPTVRVGTSFGNATRYVSARKPAIGGSTTGQIDPTAQGPLALVFLDPRKPVLEAATIPRQLFQSQVATTQAGDGSWSYTGMGIAGFSSTGVTTPLVDAGQTDGGVPIVNAVRQSAYYATLQLFTPDDPFWVRDTTSTTGKLSDADLGGPLYAQDASGNRQVYGVAVAAGVSSSQMQDCPTASCDVWADITIDANRNWILSQVQIPVLSSGASVNTNWFQRHPQLTDSQFPPLRGDGTPDWWIGDVDYTGPCQSAKDADCDHWYDQAAGTAGTADGGASVNGRDNCVGWFNPDQADVDDDGVGNVCDNCPAIVNADQTNSMPSATPVVPIVGRVAEASEEASAIAPGDGCRTWTVDHAYLNDLWVNTANDAWAVGYNALIMHWDGKSWTQMVTPFTDDLLTVWGTSSSNIFAGGYNGRIIHYDGTKWSNVSNIYQNGQLLAGSTSIIVNQVWGTGADNIWIAGSESTVARWDASAGNWTMYNKGTIYTNEFFAAIWGTSASDLWVAGDQALAHYDGSQWTYFQNAPLNAQYFLYGLWGSSSTDVWAVGEHWSSGPRDSEILHWNGSSWTETSGTSPAIFNSIGGRAANDVFIAGADGTVWNWNGSTWAAQKDKTPELHRIIARPEGLWGISDTFYGDGIWRRREPQWSNVVSTGGAQVQGVVAADPSQVVGFEVGNAVVWNGSSSTTIADNSQINVSGSWASAKNDVWAVGNTKIYKPGGGATVTPSILHYDGSAWTQPVVAGLPSLGGVGGSSAHDVWVVGQGGATFHFDGTTWTSIASGTSSFLSAVWASSPSDAWAVGTEGATLHWDGASWKNVHGISDRVALSTVWGADSQHVWAAGNGMIALWNGAGWAEVDVGAYQGAGDYITGFAGSGPNDVWAVTRERLFHFDGTIWTLASSMEGGAFTATSWRPNAGLWISSSAGYLRNVETGPVTPSCTLTVNQVGYDAACVETPTITCNTTSEGLSFQRQQGATFPQLSSAYTSPPAVPTFVDSPAPGTYSYRVCATDNPSLCSPSMEANVLATCPNPPHKKCVSLSCKLSGACGVLTDNCGNRVNCGPCINKCDILDGCHKVGTKCICV